MLNVNATIKLFKFEELPKEAKEKAIEEHRNFMLSCMNPDDYKDMADSKEGQQKIYDSEYDYYESNDEAIIENIDANDYLFFSNGELAHTVEYCGNHPRAGEMDFFFMGETIRIA